MQYFHVTQFRLLNALRCTDSRGKLDFFLNAKTIWCLSDSKTGMLNLTTHCPMSGLCV